jgi:glycosyltransferase involved in cell wall biosynthesis
LFFTDRFLHLLKKVEKCQPECIHSAMDFAYKAILSQHPNFDPAKPPQRIAPLQADANRPLWSVMIPTFNCASYLESTLRSVLEQDLGPDLMQIEVIDDCSTDNPEDVVKRVAGERVTFYRKPRNEGAIPNFNTCIERSRGGLIHILHGDDHVRGGFYEKTAAALSRSPSSPICGTLVDIIDENGSVFEKRSYMEKYSKSALDHCRDFHFGTHFQFAGVVIRRDFYEQYGGFDTRLIHCADWEMWTRAVHHGGAVVVGEHLAAYRVLKTNDTSRLRRSADNLRDQERAALVLANMLPNFPITKARWKILKRAVRQAKKFKRMGDLGAVEAHRQFLKQRTRWMWRLV